MSDPKKPGRPKGIPNPNAGRPKAEETQTRAFRLKKSEWEAFDRVQGKSRVEKLRRLLNTHQNPYFHMLKTINPPEVDYDALNRELAELLRWTEISRSWGEWLGLKPGQTKSIPLSIPDYCHDLNACHEVERSLPVRLWQVYEQEIKRLVGGSRRFCSIHATAERRTRALIATLKELTC